MTAPVRAAPITAADVELYLKPGVVAVDDYRSAAFRRGTPSADDLRTFTGLGVFITRSGGLPILDARFTRPIFTVRTVSPQQAAYDAAEAFAFHVWRCMLDDGMDKPLQVGSVRALYVAPAGGEPAEIQIDAARRRHWSCSYVIPVASGL